MSGTMTAAVVQQKGVITLDRVPLPDPPEGSIRVRVHACAICGTDIRILRKGDYRAQYPVITGHEIAGVVDAVAPGVTSVREGDRVCVAPGHGCGTCRMCRSGRPNVCVTPFPSLGYKVNGGFAEYIAVPRNIFELGFVNPIPAALSFDQASLSEIVACCINAQENAAVGRGDVVLVLGSGPAGIIHSQLALLSGASKVIVAQRGRERLDLAASLFPIHRTVAMTDQDLAAVVAEETGGEGPDVVFVCAPSREAQELALELVGPRGRVNFFGGLPKDDCVVRVDANRLHYREYFISGASSSLPEGNRLALELLAERKIDPDRLITSRFPLSEIGEAFDAAEARRGIKVVVNP